MKKLIPYTGIILITTGTLVLVTTRCSWLGTRNWLLLTGLLFIVAGIVLHIRSIKKESRY